jgi:hypothetical protein
MSALARALSSWLALPLLADACALLALVLARLAGNA